MSAPRSDRPSAVGKWRQHVPSLSFIVSHGTRHERVRASGTGKPQATLAHSAADQREQPDVVRCGSVTAGEAPHVPTSRRAVPQQEHAPRSPALRSCRTSTTPSLRGSTDRAPRRHRRRQFAGAKAIDSFADMCNEDGQLRLVIGRHNAACSPSLRLARHDLRIAGDGGGHGSRRASATWALWTCA